MIDIIINGIANQGKDTYVKLFSENNYRVSNISSVDPFRDIPKKWGWDGEKNEKYRICLVNLKKIAVEFNDYPTKYLLEQRLKIMNSSLDNIIFYHIREIEEIEKLKKELLKVNNDVITLLVKSNKLQTVEEGIDKNNFNEKYYDVIIYNDFDLDYLKSMATLEYIFKRKEVEKYIDNIIANH